MAGFFYAVVTEKKKPWRANDEMNTTRTGKMAAVRQRKRWTQFELARRVGCSESQIAKIETGRASPRDWLKEAIARELGIATWEVVL